MVAPVATELFGMRSTQAHVGALEDNTTITVTASNGAQINYVLNSGNSQLIGGVGSAAGHGAGSALHIQADKPIGAVQVADGDGSSASAFLPMYLADTRYIVPIDAQYAFLACADAGAKTQVSRPGAAVETYECAAAGDVPGRIFLGSTSGGVHLEAGTSI